MSDPDFAIVAGLWLAVIACLGLYLWRDSQSKAPPEDDLPAERYRIKCSWWRKWLLHRALVWATYGSPRKASLCWRLARIFPHGDVELACAAYCGQLLMMGD